MNEKVFRDPIHNYIHVSDPIIYELINTREFQRLRRIKQVPTTSYTFHGAEHSRFSHCLGVYEIARKITKIFNTNYSDIWNSSETLITLVAALLHDIGHGAYSHTFELLFQTNHESYTQHIITDPSTEIHQILLKVAPDFPKRVASVIDHTYHNKQVVQLISSQIDCDRMDYLLRDSYYTAANYGQFDLTRILRVIRPTKDGIVFLQNGMHAVEDYIVSRYQMYMQVYFHPASRAMEVLLQNLLNRAKVLFQSHSEFFEKTSSRLVPFLNKTSTLHDYLSLDDGVMSTYFQEWMNSDDLILADLAKRFINRKVFTSLIFSDNQEKEIAQLKSLIANVGFDPKYYSGVHISFDLPYDIYRPSKSNPRTQIEILHKDGQVSELSKLSPIVNALTGANYGDKRFYFPKEMLSQNSIFKDEVDKFISIYTGFDNELSSR